MTTMKEVMDAGNVVVAAHAKLLEASDALAEVLEFNPEFVLRRVMPLKAEDRRNTTKILDYLESDCDEIEKHLKDVAKVRAQDAAREELLTKLNLSDTDKKLLGIEF